MIKENDTLLRPVSVANAGTSSKREENEQSHSNNQGAIIIVGMMVICLLAVFMYLYRRGRTGGPSSGSSKEPREHASVSDMDVSGISNGKVHGSAMKRVELANISV